MDFERHEPAATAWFPLARERRSTFQLDQCQILAVKSITDPTIAE